MLTVPERLMRRVLNARGLRSRWLDTRAGRLHVLDGPGRGKLPPVVMLHGFSANSISYLGLLRRLAPHARRLVAPDCPGHGFSECPPQGLGPDAMVHGICDVLDHVIDEPALLVGTSMGGFGAVRYAARSPARVRGLVLICPGGAPMSGPQLREFLATFRLAGHRDALRFVDRMLCGSPPLLRHALARGIYDRFTHPQMLRLLDRIGPADLLRPAELAALRMPTLMLWGRNERILPPDHIEFFRRHLPAHAQLEIWNDFGHCGYLERPGDVSQRIVEFSRTLFREGSTMGPSPLDAAAQTMTRSVHRTAHLH